MKINHYWQRLEVDMTSLYESTNKKYFSTGTLFDFSFLKIYDSLFVVVVLYKW